ncbi:hypothetical protein D3C71_1930830 [compost metagenome]
MANIGWGLFPVELLSKPTQGNADLTAGQGRPAFNRKLDPLNLTTLTLTTNPSNT